MRVAGYVAPESLDAAFGLLKSDTTARALAGGNSLLVEPHRNELTGTKLVDLGRIPGLAGIASSEGGLRIGAMTTLAAVCADATVLGRYPALAETVRLVGDAQVRNRATIGGNLADRDRGVDVPAVLVALRAQVQIQGQGGSRTVPVDDLLSGSLPQGELITSVTLPAPAARTGSAYEKFKHPATLYAICGVAASATLGADGSVSACAVALTGATAATTRLAAVEGALTGKQPDTASLSAAAQRAGEGLTCIGDHFASAEYRLHLTKVLTLRALTRAIERAGR